MKNDFNYKWSKLFASKRFHKKDGIITLTPLEQDELLNDAESLVKKLALSGVVVSETELCEHLDKNNKCRMMCLTRCVEGNKFWK